MPQKSENGEKFNFKAKKTLVMGLGIHGGGVGTVKFLAKKGACITVTDLRSEKDLAASLKQLSGLKDIRYTFGRHEEKDFLSADIIIKNPGVRPDSPYLALARARGIPITTDMGIFFSASPATIIGVTGTRGKSTAAFLIWKFLRTKYPRTFLAGNIRKSVFEFMDALKKGDRIVLELSSFQLHDLRSVTAGKFRKSPHIAVLTNILRDHLNWHATMKEYRDAKRMIFECQTPDDYLFANPSDPLVRAMAERAPSRVVFAALPPALKKITDANLGAHYEPSVALAAAVAKHFKISAAAIRKTLAAFHGLEGRQEECATIRGVHYVNDTTSTVPDATLAAIRRFREKAGKGKLILIAGGQDKKLDFREMARAILSSADRLILLPGTGTEKVKKELRMKNYEFGTGNNAREATSMHEAVKTASEIAQKGDWVVLSPGAASFGLFLNEFDRGNAFVKEIQKLKKTPR